MIWNLRFFVIWINICYRVINIALRSLSGRCPYQGLKGGFMKREHMVFIMVLLICVGWVTPVAADECDIANRLVRKVQEVKPTQTPCRMFCSRLSVFVRQWDGRSVRKPACGLKMMNVSQGKNCWKRLLCFLPTIPVVLKDALYVYRYVGKYSYAKKIC